MLQWQINGLISYKIMSEPQNGMQHCNMIELRKRNFGTKQFFFYTLHIGYACEIILISRLVSEAKLKCRGGRLDNIRNLVIS